MTTPPPQGQNPYGAQSKCEAEAEGFKYAYTETGGSKSFVLCLDDA
ncbi:hypothetical protein Sdia_09900 [Streptomyces diastaticus subsp. diastaticus]|uniref:Uncharacterized protein n=1 Tax=Streptomyces diastaticus subsp. diastaticus TaxID=68040 RepID=A0ABQ1CIK3_STRDI|nr:hypothetical protein [Streptomyces diastaticus]GFH70222.1 hypothetical protein Sdia_09900 [Streptomyces diastaticus subsp. diastaticus]GGU15935.1 hypothetical protein GCM10015534_18360 [Streptomyces diastaticus subsp. diastaticus]